MILQRKCFGLWEKVKDTFSNATKSKKKYRDKVLEGIEDISKLGKQNSDYNKEMDSVIKQKKSISDDYLDKWNEYLNNKGDKRKFTETNPYPAEEINKLDKRKSDLRLLIKDTIDKLEGTRSEVDSNKRTIRDISDARRNLAIAGAIGLGTAGFGYGIYRWRKNKKKQKEAKDNT